MAVARKVKEMMERSSWIRKMFETGARLKALHGADKVCDFSLGNPNLEPPQEFTTVLADLTAQKVSGTHRYMPNAGYPEVRRRVAEYISKEQDQSLNEKHVIMTCGAGGALNVALKTILNPGDEVLAVTPCFVEYGFYADNHGGKLIRVPCAENFDLDIPALESRVNASTAALIINSPNNPSGFVYPEESIRSLGEMLDRKSRETGRTIYLISDEPYRKITFDGVKVPSVFTAYKNTFAASSYSKDLSIPGERIGFLAVHPGAEDADNLIDGMILCNRILGYVNAPALMQRAVAELQGRSVDTSIYQRKRDLLCRGLSGIGYEFVKPKGTFYLFPRSPSENDLQIVEALQKELILTVPGRGFGCPGYFRIAFCVADDVIERSFEGFEKAFKQFR
jgi:aspartate aminotransferase